jgi:hypothetical protein
MVLPPLVDRLSTAASASLASERFETLGLSIGSVRPHPACALIATEKPVALSRSEVSKGRIEIFMALPLVNYCTER